MDEPLKPKRFVESVGIFTHVVAVQADPVASGFLRLGDSILHHRTAYSAMPPCFVDDHVLHYRPGQPVVSEVGDDYQYSSEPTTRPPSSATTSAIPGKLLIWSNALR